MIENAVSDLAQHVKTDGGLFVYNPNGFACGGVVDVDGKKQYVADIPALGYRVVKETQAANTIAASKQALENAFYKISFDAQGNITSLFDKTHGREVVKPGANSMNCRCLKISQNVMTHGRLRSIISRR